MQDDHSDQGFGLTEVVISMLILAIVMMAILSLLITSVTSVAANSTKATAAQLASDRIELVRSASSTGDCVRVLETAEQVETVADGRGVELTVSGSVDNCVQPGDAHSHPVLARVTIQVTTTQPDFDNPVVETTSDIYVKFDPQS